MEPESIYFTHAQCILSRWRGEGGEISKMEVVEIDDDDDKEEDDSVEVAHYQESHGEIYLLSIHRMTISNSRHALNESPNSSKCNKENESVID